MNPCSARELGQFPLSIATSLALEGLCGIYPERPVAPAPIERFSGLWINIRTLYRNLLGAMAKDSGGGHPLDFVDALMFEMEKIPEVLQEYTTRPLEITYYLSNYKGLERRHRHAVLRMDTTPKQKEYTFIMTKTIEILLKQLENHPLGELTHVFDLKLKNHDKSPARKSTAILTHYAFDLTSRYEFNELVLLESHTGVLKNQNQWFTKYTNGKELPMIPFREDFLTIFGDNETFRPMDIKLRRELIELGTSHKWGPTTTKDRILLSLRDLKNPYSRDLVKDILI